MRRRGSLRLSRHLSQFVLGLAVLETNTVQSQLPHPSFKPPRRTPIVEFFSDAELSAACALLDDATATAMWAAEAHNGESLDPRALAAAWSSLDAGAIFVPSSRELLPRAGATEAQRIEAAKATFAERAAAYVRSVACLEPLAARVATLTRGFEAKVVAAGEATRVAAAENADALIVLACLSRRAADEVAALPQRLNESEALAHKAAHQEAAMQESYRQTVTLIQQAMMV